MQDSQSDNDKRHIIRGSPERHLSRLLQDLALNVTHKPLQRLFDGVLGNSITLGGHRG